MSPNPLPRCLNRYELPSSFRFGLPIIIIAALLVGGCTKPSAPPAPAAEKPKVEGELAKTNLSDDAYKSLSIASEVVHNQQVQEQIPLTGWIMAKQGHEVTVTAPVAGYVRDPASGRSAPVSGLNVQNGQELLTQVSQSVLVLGEDNDAGVVPGCGLGRAGRLAEPRKARALVLADPIDQVAYAGVRQGA